MEENLCMHALKRLREDPIINGNGIVIIPAPKGIKIELGVAAAVEESTSNNIEEEEGKSLSAEQQQVLLLANKGISFFYTGAAGSGKSHVLHLIRKSLLKKYKGKGVYVVAPTGIAAANVCGVTIHNFAGIGIKDESVDVQVEKIKHYYTAHERWKNANVLIIDEVSMLSCDLFERLEEIATRVRNVPDMLFGGIQIILCGDFYQLPPVDRKSSLVKYCFQSPLWNKLIMKNVVVLKQIYRQEEITFAEVLNDIREGNVTTTCIEKLKPRLVLEFTPYVTEQGLEPTKLFTINERVDSYNADRLEQLIVKTEAVKKTYLSNDVNPNALFGLMIPMKLELCIGAQVMCLYNFPGLRLVNGSLGKVTDVRDDGTIMVYFHGRYTPVAIPKVKVEIFEGSRVVASREQYPLKLAWAMSIHKSQGMSIDLLDVDLTRIFTLGQVYVALSRARTLEGLRIKGFRAEDVKCHLLVKQFYASLQYN